MVRTSPDAQSYPSDSEAESPAPAEAKGGSALASWSLLGLLIVVVVVWISLIRRFGEGDVYAVIGPYACAVSVLMWIVRPRALASWLRPNPRSLLIGLAVGAVMTLLTYPVFQLAVRLFPELDANVQALYVGARSTTLPKALVWTTAAAIAEELLFRGVLPDVLAQVWSRSCAARRRSLSISRAGAARRREVGQRGALALSLAVYVLAQMGTGSWIVGLMALVCGAIWTVQRAWTGSLLSPLISHLIWTPTVILLYPVT